MKDAGRHNVLGVQINAVDYEAAVDRIAEAAQSAKPLGVSALAVHGVMTGALDPEHRYRLNQLELVVPDGQPVRWALNWLHRVGLKDRVCGPHLMLETCRRAAADGLPIYLFGSTDEVLADLRENLREQFPDLQIAGWRSSRFRQLNDDEAAELVEEIKQSGAKITFIGLGCPRQEIWAFEFREALQMPVLAVGAAYDFHAKRLSRCPTVLQDRGLEWLYRLVQEPKRLWRRYCLLNPLYLTYLGMQLTGIRRFDSSLDRPPQEKLLYG